jgi:hypothetical protein
MSTYTPKIRISAVELACASISSQAAGRVKQAPIVRKDGRGFCLSGAGADNLPYKAPDKSSTFIDLHEREGNAPHARKASE